MSATNETGALARLLAETAVGAIVDNGGGLTISGAVREKLGEELVAVAERQLAEQAETLGAYRTQHRRLIRELDVALNGAAGAAPQAAMCDLIAQIERQQCVQILNLADGMRINFRAPDGRRATLYVDVVLEHAEQSGIALAVAETMRAAVAAYPVAGVAFDAPAEPRGTECERVGHAFEPGAETCTYCDAKP